MRALLVCLALVSGCRTKECTDGTVLVDVTLTSTAADADALDVAVTVDGQTLRDRVTHSPGNPHGTLQIEFPGGYPGGKALSVQVTASRGGQPVASGSALITLSAACGNVALVVDQQVMVSDLSSDDIADAGVSDLSGDMTPVLTGQISIADVIINTSVDAGGIDGGNAQGRILAVLPSFIQEVKHDYDDTVPFMGFRLGCVADHYVSPGKLPPDDLDDGIITLSGYSTNTGAPPTATCMRTAGRYGCIFGGDAGVTPVTNRVFPAILPLFPANTSIRFQSSGGTVSPAFGSFDQTVAAQGSQPNVVTDVTQLKYTGTSDIVLFVQCAGCIGLLVNVKASPNSVNNIESPSATFGSMTCTMNAQATMVIPKAAVAAMIGNDATLQTFRTTIIGGVPGTVVDSTGKTVVLIPARGQVGYSIR